MDKKSILSLSIYYMYYHFNNKAIPLWAQTGFYNAIPEKKNPADSIMQAVVAVPDSPYT